MDHGDTPLCAVAHLAERVAKASLGGVPSSPKRNELLAALPDDVLKRWLAEGELVTLEAQQVLHSPGVKLKFAHFPVSGMIAMIVSTASDATGQVALVGREGAAGLLIMLTGEPTTPAELVVEASGQAWRFPAPFLKEEMQDEAVRTMVLRFVQALTAQIGQNAICNRHHTLAQQLARLLLMTHDRVRSDELRLTQALIAQLLGVRREGVTEAASKLQEQGVVRYTRGRIRLLDRPALEKASCECYAVIQREYARLLPAFTN